MEGTARGEPGQSALWVEGGFDGVVATGLSVAMALISPRDLTILYTNPAWDELFGYLPGEAHGQPASIVSAESDEEQESMLRTMIASLAEHGVWHGRVRKVRKSGEELWSMTHLSTVPHPELGEVWVSLQTGVDLGEVGPGDGLHEEGQGPPLGAVSEAELQRLRGLADIDDQKNLFLRAVSHDLRTPLTIMQGFASLLATQDDRLDPAERRHYAARIEAGARRLQRQLNDLLDLDRLSRGVITPQRRPTDLRRLAADVVEALDLAHRVTVQGEPVTVTVDPAQVERIIENLLANAARHAPPDCRIEFRSEPVDDGVLISVEDDGPGVPPELREDVFDVFHKVNASSPGSGVGLPLVRRFAEVHGGRVWVEDRPGGGAAFRVFLPASDT